MDETNAYKGNTMKFFVFIMFSVCFIAYGLLKIGYYTCQISNTIESFSCTEYKESVCVNFRKNGY